MERSSSFTFSELENKKRLPQANEITPKTENNSNPYGYEVVSMDRDNTDVGSTTGIPPRKRRRQQRRNSKTPAMLRFTANAPLLVRLDLLEDEKEQVNELFMNMNFFPEESSSFHDSYNSELSSSLASLAVETAEELVTQANERKATKRKSFSKL